MIDHDDTNKGAHYWASTADGSILVVLKVGDDQYEVCGPWECGIGAHECEIIEEINPPFGYEHAKLYYCDQS